jgi:hypothetical protein
MSSPNMTRNITQTYGDRSVAKQASDLVVYIDGANYLINPFISAAGTSVPFNNFVNAWSSSYDVDTMVPSGSLTLVVPVQFAALFELPGGNKILKSMAAIQVYAKGYYFSAQGNTVYHTIFKGYITAVNSTNDGMHVTYTLPCRGSLGLLERMQIDQTPGTQSSSPLSVTPFVSNYANLDPYGLIAFIFIYSSMVDGFTLASLQQAKEIDADNPYRAAIEERFVAKWQALLYDLARDVHIFGAPNVTDVIGAIELAISKPDSAASPMDKEALGIWTTLLGSSTESTTAENQMDFYQQIRGYHPDFQIGTIQLFNGQTTTRLERLRYLVGLIGFEAYQDVDGGIIVKPPLYNLDVTNILNDGSQSNPDLVGLATALGSPSLANIPADPQPSPAVTWITAEKNPYVVHAWEIDPGESETEDEAGVRLTRIQVFGNMEPSFQWNGPVQVRTIAEDVDIIKLSQYGLRSEPPIQANMFRDGDKAAIFAYAASELAKMNKGYRTYTCQIPMRPELKLGFPMYFPHKDMYGYIKTITMQWVRGGDATTSITCDALRFRPLFPIDQSAPVLNQSNTQNLQLTRFMTESPNLVMAWTQLPSVTQAAMSVSQGVQAIFSGASSSTPTQTSKGQANANPSGRAVTLPLPQELVVKQQDQMLKALKAGSSFYTPNNDTATHNWRIQPDLKNEFSLPRTLDASYYETLRTVRPYTDDKGYELIGPFPWGRFKSLQDSLSTFTVLNPVFNAQQAAAVGGLPPVNPAAANITNANSFMFTGDSAVASSEPATQLLNDLNTQRGVVNNFKVFELAYTSDPTNVPGPKATLGASAPAQPSANTDEMQNASAAATFVTSSPQNESVFNSILNSIPSDDDANIGLF